MVSQEHKGQANDTTGPRASRLLPVDALRGLIMVFMALDHANHFVAQKHSPGEYWGGPFPAYSDALAFLTRLVTHPAAPGFFFLMGLGMVLFAHSRRQRGWSDVAVVWHFLTRGALLIALQLLVVNRAWELSPGGWGLRTYVGVLFALGGAMMLSGPLLWLKPAHLVVLTAALTVGTEWLTPDPSLWGHTFHPIVRLALVPGGDRGLWVNYPVLPWLGLVVFGMLFGHRLLVDRQQAFRRALKLGAALLLTFLVVRCLGGFGNIRPRSGSGWIGFLNVIKYPPSVTFNLLTMGVLLIILGWFGRAGNRAQRLLRPLVVYGQAPLFFYVTHLFLYAGLGWLLTPNGTSIPQMYPYWLLGLVILYPFCVWYGQLKRRQPLGSPLRFF